MNYYIFIIKKNKTNITCANCNIKYQRFIKYAETKSIYDTYSCPSNCCEILLNEHNNYKGLYIKKDNIITVKNTLACLELYSINDLIYKLII